MKKSISFPLVKTPDKIDMALFLIRETLKIRKLFNTLNKIGLSDCDYEPNLDTLILKLLGFDDGTDETFLVYLEIMDRRSKKVCDRYQLTRQTFKVYQELLAVKKLKEKY